MKVFGGPAGFQRIVNLILSVVMGTGLTVYPLWVAQNAPGNEMAPIFTPVAVITGTIIGFAVGYVVCDIIPASRWGNQLTARFNNSIVKHLISTLVGTAVYVTIISIIMTCLMNVDHMPLTDCLMMWVSLAPGFWLIGYILLLIFTPLALVAGKAGSGFDPAAAH